jgi:hypothetical protein
MPHSSKVMTQTKRDTPALQVGGWEWGWQSHPVKLIFVEKLLKFKSDGNNKDETAWTRINKWKCGMCCLCIEVVHCRTWSKWCKNIRLIC